MISNADVTNKTTKTPGLTIHIYWLIASSNNTPTHKGKS